MRTWLAVLIGLMAALSGVVLLVWLLWRLWTGEEEVAPAAVGAIEIEVPQVPVVEVPEAEVPERPVEPEEPEAREAGAPVEPEEPGSRAAPSAPAEPDDLTVIEGIGPKISMVLREGGIQTFGQLAGTSPDEIRAILEAADPRLGRLADPGTWPDQAALAAEGDWQALAGLQSTLKGGRKA